MGRKLEVGKLGAYSTIADGMLDAALYLVELVRDTDASATVRRQAVVDVLSIGGVMPKPNLSPSSDLDKPLDKMTAEELDALIRAGSVELEARAQEARMQLPVLRETDEAIPADDAM